MATESSKSVTGPAAPLPASRGRLSTLCIDRPVATALVMLALLLGGLLGWRFMPLSALPQVDYPTIEVQTLYPGASADVMSRVVTAPLERTLGQMSGLQRMSSTSGAGVSVITLQFSLGLSLDVAEQDVQAALNAAGSSLPTDLPTPPVYAKVNPADAPILTLALRADSTLPLTEVQDIANTRLAPKISQISGVGRVLLGGGQRPALRIQVDPRALAARGLSLESVRTALGAANASGATGSLDGPARAYSIQANNQLQSVEEAAHLIIGASNGGVVRLADVARVERGPENRELAAWAGHGCGHPKLHCGSEASAAAGPTLNPAIVLSVQRQPGANVIRTVDAIHAQLPYLRAQLPPAMTLEVLSDRTEVIRASVTHVQWELALAVVMVVLVIFAFLRSGPATAIAAVAVPLSLVGTLSLCYLLGYSINNLTLMALTIAAGFVVDDVIVVLENTARHLEAGLPPKAAARAGVRQIGFTIVSLTVSLVAVLIPLLFMGGVVGRLFQEFAVTLALSIGLSAVVSLTLVPMLSARWLRHVQPSSLPTSVLARAPHRRGWRERALAAYDARLRRVLARPGWTWLGAGLTLALTVALYSGMPKGLFPVQDTGQLQARLSAAPDVSFTRMQTLQAATARALLADPDVASLSSFVGVDAANNAQLHTARLLITLRPGHDRLDTVMARLHERSTTVAGVSLALQPVQDLTLDAETGPTAHRVALEGADSAEVNRWAQRLAQALQSPQAMSTVRHAQTDAGATGPTVHVALDRDTAARLGVSANAVDDLLYNALGQRVISTLFTETDQIRIVLEADPHHLQTPAELAELPVKSRNGQTTPLSALARVSEGQAPLQVLRAGQFPAAVLGFDTAPGVALEQAVNTVRATAQAIELPASITLQFLGAAGAFETALSQQLWLILAAVVCVYIVLGVLYESFIHPLTILSTLPSAGVGALLTLWLAGQALNVVGIIGLILLIGIVKKNAIMMIDFALDAQRHQGLSARDAIHQAALLRLRPILMTTAAALLAAVPLMLGGGPGAELRLPLGLAIFGGLVVSQWLTLFTTPVIYLGFEQLRQRRDTPTPGARSMVA